ncbi:MAG TPA: ATPase [Sphaerochaeta sp.]|nr:ATPase [Sphaerochaeta sp.]
MKRSITNRLILWKDDENRKPLLLSGVRQCGKTYVLKEFGENCFQDYAYLNFESDDRLKAVFDYDFNVERILKELSFICFKRIEPGKTLLILDEIQECPRAITSLKYFCENMRDLHIICAGSLLGVALARKNISFPVGKVNRMKMYPMSFKEFLWACGADQVAGILEDWPTDRPIPEVYSVQLSKFLKEYYSVGGMPEAVAEWTASHDIQKVETIQDEILLGYSDDFAKHAPLDQVEKIHWIWNSVPKQLAKENNKFVFSHVKEGKRAAELEDALQWLRDAGLVIQLELVEKPEIPLASMADSTYFKVYLSDVGLLRRMSGLSARTIMEEDSLFIRFKGALAENYAVNELTSSGEAIYFWRSGNTAEVDIVMESDGLIIPIEVKSADNTQAKSYRQFCKRYTPSIGFRLSMKNIGENECEGTRTISLPLWMLWNWSRYR